MCEMMKMHRILSVTEDAKNEIGCKCSSCQMYSVSTGPAIDQQLHNFTDAGAFG
jgi:Fe-S cluster biogenesis protein NfuA